MPPKGKTQLRQQNGRFNVASKRFPTDLSLSLLCLSHVRADVLGRVEKEQSLVYGVNVVELLDMTANALLSAPDFLPLAKRLIDKDAVAHRGEEKAGSKIRMPQLKPLQNPYLQNNPSYFGL